VLLSWQVFTGLAGGVGLFLLGMQLMTDGLKQSAGKSLQQILSRSTSTPLRGIASGALITSAVQSSSAVTVASIGFVNAGLMQLKQAIYIIYGSNLGTTMTGWLVAIIGFHVEIKVFALPAIGVGMLMNLLMTQGRYAAIGKVLAGFGLFFLGIDLMKSGFSDLQGMIPLTALEEGGLLGMVVFVGIGFLMTLVMQSSSASIAMTLTAAAGGVVALPAAACMVIGANVGTTSTAVLAAIGATPNARRMAAAHVIFNIATAVVAVLILPLLLYLFTQLQQQWMLDGGVATFLAMFHTGFNLLGVLLLLPFTTRMVNFLKTRFRAAEEDEARPRFLDDTLIDAPDLAHKALVMELQRIQLISIKVAEDAINTEASFSPRISADRFVLDSLSNAVGTFASKLRRGHLPEDVAESLPHALAATRYFVEMAELAAEIDQQQSQQVTDLSDELGQSLAGMRKLAIVVLDAGRLEQADEADLPTTQVLEKHYEHIKSLLLRAGACGQLSGRQMVTMIELMKNIERLVKHAIKGQAALRNFSQALQEESRAGAVEPDVGAL